MSNSENQGSHKPLQIFLAVVIAVAFIGFFVGTRSGVEDPHAANAKPTISPPGGEAMQARTYTEILEHPLASNQQWERSIERLADDRPDLFAEVENTPEELRQALAARAERRAYRGAPPTVPHPVKQTGDLACAACHSRGLQVRGRTAPAMSHEFMTNCTQCHVPGTTPVPVDPSLDDQVPTANSFAGLPEPTGGPVAWYGAPPQTPHQTFMRSECTSCHGTLGKEGMKSPHPWRQSCQQCHAPSSSLNQGMPPTTLEQPIPLARP